jgi:hypothetical protein
MEPLDRLMGVHIRKVQETVATQRDGSGPIQPVRQIPYAFLGYFPLIDLTRNFKYNSTIGITIRSAIRPVSY